MSDRATLSRWLMMKARKAGVSVHDLRQWCEEYTEIKRRSDERHYCESCGKKIYDGNLEEPQLDDYGTDEEGLEFCNACCLALSDVPAVAKLMEQTDG